VTKPTDEQLAALGRILSETTDQEIDCAEVLHRVAPLLKALCDRADLSTHLQQVEQHLRICPECREEFVALIKAEGLDPATVLKSDSPE